MKNRPLRQPFSLEKPVAHSTASKFSAVLIGRIDSRYIFNSVGRTLPTLGTFFMNSKVACDWSVLQAVAILCYTHLDIDQLVPRWSFTIVSSGNLYHIFVYRSQ